MRHSFIVGVDVQQENPINHAAVRHAQKLILLVLIRQQDHVVVISASPGHDGEEEGGVVAVVGIAVHGGTQGDQPGPRPLPKHGRPLLRAVVQKTYSLQDPQLGLVADPTLS